MDVNRIDPISPSIDPSFVYFSHSLPSLPKSANKGKKGRKKAEKRKKKKEKEEKGEGKGSRYYPPDNYGRFVAFHSENRP